MKNRILKIVSIATFILVISAGVSVADHDRRHPRGYAYGHYRQKVVHHYHHPAPPPVYHGHYYRPVVVAPYYHHQPVRIIQPRGFVFGMSFVDAAAGAAFSFGVGGR